MIATLAVLATLATVGISVSDAPLERKASDLHLVIAEDSGTHRKTTLPLSDAQLRGVKHLWAWTSRFPPRKLDPATFPLIEQAILAELERSPSRGLEVRIRGWSRPEELVDVRVIAAPSEMWGSVPEPLLPSFAVSRDGRVTIPVRDPVRIRVAGEQKGTAWQQSGSSARSVDLVLRPATDAELTLQMADGSPPARAFATAMSIGRGEPIPILQAQFAADDRGRLRIPSLPDAEIVTLVMTAPGAAPRTLSGTAAELSRVVRLAKAATVRGTFVDEEGEPLPGARVHAEGWISPEVAALSADRAVTDDRGRWLLSSLPRVRVVVRATKEGRATFRKEVSLEEGDADLGTIALMPSVDVALTVVDASDHPLPKVRVTSDGGFTDTTRDDGTISVTGLASDQPVSLELTAERFASQTIQFSPPLPKRERVVLERAFTVTGGVTDDAGIPLTNAMAIVTVGTRYRRESIGPSGTFSFDVDAGKEFEVTFESSSSASVVRKESAGRIGEIRDLGTIRLPSGSIVRGRIVDPAGVPVRDARVWAIRPHIGGAVAAWVAGRIVQAASDGNGAFELRGVPPGAALLRIDALDFARAWRSVTIADSPLDVGAIEIVRGSSVRVKSRHDDAVARLDLRGEWLDVDMLSAPVVSGEAHIRNVPAGRFRVTVLDGRAVVCDRHAEVEEGSDASVECPGPMIVRGRVLLDGTPAYAGSLTWTQPAGADALIDTRMSPGGARQQRVYGVSSGTIVVALRADGTFETDQLRAGEWQVSWRSADNTGTPARAVTIPDAPEARIVVEYAGGVIRGRVVDARHQSVTGARIREIQGPLFAMSASDGSFTLTGVAAGAHRLQASLGVQTSRVVDVNVESGKQTPELLFELDDAERNTLAVRVSGLDGEPKPNAFVFVEAVDGIRILTAGANGVASGAFPAGLQDGARLVAFADNAWAFAQLRRSGAGSDPQSATIRFERTGSLSIRSRTSSGAPAVLSSLAGDLTWMMVRVGYPVSLTPESPLVIDGLPPGLYEVALGSTATTVSVRAGTTVNADLP